MSIIVLFAYLSLAAPMFGQTVQADKKNRAAKNAPVGKKKAVDKKNIVPVPEPPTAPATEPMEIVFSPPKVFTSKMREFYFSTGYLTAAASNESIGLFNLQLLQVTTIPGNYVNDGFNFLMPTADNWTKGSLRLLTGVGTWYLIDKYLQWPLSIAYHEFGHGTRGIAAGFAARYDFNLAPGTYYDNYFNYLWQAARQPVTGGTTSYTYTGQFAYQPPNWNHIITAGGVNNEMYQTELIANEMFWRKAHFLYLPIYASGKQASKRYMSALDPDTDTTKRGDLTNILDYYAKQGYGVTRADINAAAERSIYLSSGTYLLLWSAVKYVLTGNPYITSEFFGFRTPELLSYHARNGLTHKVLAGYRWRNWHFPVSYEWVIKGDQQHELGLDARRLFENVVIFGGVILGRGVGANAGMEYKLYSLSFADAVLKVKLTYHNVQTFEGERNIRSLQEGFSNALSTEVALGVVY